MSDPVRDFVAKVGEMQLTLVEGWLRAHLSHGAKPPQIDRRAGKADMLLSCECGERLRVWVVLENNACIITAKILTEPA